jgi:hypothetical protein
MPDTDGLRSLSTGMRICDAWHKHGQVFLNVDKLDFVDRIYPPFLDICYAIYCYIFGLQTGRELIVGTVFLIITLISIYGLSRTLYNEKVALFASVIFLSFPGVFKYSRSGKVEFALMGMVSLAIYFLVLADYFSNRKYSFIFGVILGLTALTKWSFLIYITAPLLIVLSGYISHLIKDKNAVRKSINFLSSVAITSIITLPWYVFHFRDFINRVYVGDINFPHKVFFKILNAPLVLLPGFNFYIRVFMEHTNYYWVNNFGVLSCFLIIFILCQINRYIVNYNSIGIIKYERFYLLGPDKTLLFFLWIIVPYILLSLLAFNGGIMAHSHFLPILPAIAIVISAGVFSISIRVIRYIIIIFMILVSAPYLNINLCLPFINISGERMIPTRIGISLSHKFPFYYIKLFYDSALNLKKAYFLPTSESRMERDTLNFILDDYGYKKGNPKVLLVSPDYGIIGAMLFDYYNLQMSRKALITRQVMFSDYNPISLKNNIMSSFDYIILAVFPSSSVSKERWESPSYRKIVEVIESNRKEFDTKYKDIKEFIFPNSFLVVIYKKISI